MTEPDRHDELIRRLLAGEDPVALGRDGGDPQAVAEAVRALEALALTPEPVEPSAGLRGAILEAATPASGMPGFVRRTADFFQVDEAYARELLASLDHVDREPWFDDPTAGVRMRPVQAGPGLADAAACLLVHIEPGIAYPSHRHLGDELCLFLRGRGLEGNREWYAGDLVVNPGGSHHSELAADDEEPFAFAIVLYEGADFSVSSPD